MTCIPFLDTSCSIIEGRIDTDLFKKKTVFIAWLIQPSSDLEGHTFWVENEDN